MANDTPVPQNAKLVVLQNGRRVSKQVHESMASAEAERSQYVQQLRESGHGASAPSVTIAQLLLG